MAKIKVTDLLNDFHRMADEHWAYEANAEEEYCVDCSGAFVWAFRQHGKSIPHGSNRIARTAVGDILPISEAKPGMAAFKALYPGAEKYELPAAYQDGGAYYDGDPCDYFHIGLVTEDGMHVLNARSTKDGFVTSTIYDGWSFCAYLTDVDYGDEPVEPEPVPAPVPKPAADMYRVVGGRLNLRESPAKHAPAIRSLGEGEIIQVIGGSASPEWAKVKAGRETGYVMAQYLEPLDGAVVVPGVGGEEYIAVPRSAWEVLLMAINAVKAAAEQ